MNTAAGHRLSALDSLARRSEAKAAQLSAILWPCPQAWASLAAVWIVILAIDFSLRDESETVARQVVPPSPQVVIVLEQQKRLLAELIGQPPPVDAHPPNPVLLRPRSERHNELLMA